MVSAAAAVLNRPGWSVPAKPAISLKSPAFGWRVGGFYGPDDLVALPGIHRELGLQPGAAGCGRRRAHPGYPEGRDRAGRERRRLQRADTRRYRLRERYLRLWRCARLKK